MLLRRNQYPLKKLPALIWVHEFEFDTHLSFDECLARLGSVFKEEADGSNTIIYEIVVHGEIIYFAASKVFRTGKLSGSADLGGMIVFPKDSNRVRVTCYVGEERTAVVFTILFYVFLVIAGFILYGLTQFAVVVVGIASLIMSIVVLIGSILSREMKAAIKVDIQQLFADGIEIHKHPLTR